MKQNKRNTSKLLLPSVVLAAILVSTLTTLLVGGLTSRSKVPEGYISIEDVQALLAAVTLPAGYLEDSNEDISAELGSEISSAVAEMEASYLASPPTGGPTVKARDWSVYSSPLGKKNLAAGEAEFYDRLDALCRKYINGAALDGVRNETYSCYTTGEVPYSDLNLTKDQALAVLGWFRYNSPQYYFLASGSLSTSQALYPYIYDFAASGAERVDITNELFDKLDGWIASVNGNGFTTWQKELAANNLLCRNIVYNSEYMGDLRIDQSLYSAVIMESTVCAGYAKAFCAMMNASGIETTVGLGSGHAWNVVRLDDGNYYAVDVTWNDNKDDDNKPYNGYFNVGETSSKAGDTESESHTYRDPFAAWIPAISPYDYSPTAYDMTGSSGTAVELDAPGNLRVTDDKDGVISFSWDPVDNASEYTVELYYGDGNQRQLSFPVTGSAVSVNYHTYPALAVRVRAEAVAGGEIYMSGWSELLSVQTNPAQASGAAPANGVQLDAPENIRVTKNEAEASSFSWDAVEGADQYQSVLFKDAGHTQTWLSIFTAETSDGYIKLQPGTTYYCGIRAVKTVDGEDYYSDWTYFTLTTAAGD